MSSELIARLRVGLQRPQAYAHPVGVVSFGQTHISLLVFAGERVYKLKKALRLAFLDYSTLERRRAMCEREVALNRRLAPRVYLGVSAVLEAPDGTLRMGEPDALPRSGERVLEWATSMLRLPAEGMLDRLLAEGRLDVLPIRALAELLARFHAGAATGPGVDEHGTPEAVSRLVLGNLDELLPFVGEPDPQAPCATALLSPTLWAFLRRGLSAFIDEHRPLLARRVIDGRIRDGHGDLHAGNICSTPDGPVIYDCIEFNAAFRCGDVAADLGFLAMDLDRAGFSAFARHLVKHYVALSGDRELVRLLPFYKTHRALVRAKVAGLSLGSGDLSPDERLAMRRSGLAHARLAASYGLGPWVALTCGLPGTGKSWIARRAARALGASVLRTDVIRKRLAGLAPGERPRDAGQAALLYAPERVDDVYEEITAQALRRLSAGRAVVVDATFSRACWRRPLLEGARRLGARVVLLHVTCSEVEVARRLERRGGDRSEPSDADLAVFQRVRERFEAPDEVPPSLRLDAPSGEDDEAFLARLVDRLVAQQG